MLLQIGKKKNGYVGLYCDGQQRSYGVLGTFTAAPHSIALLRVILGYGADVATDEPTNR